MYQLHATSYYGVIVELRPPNLKLEFSVIDVSPRKPPNTLNPKMVDVPDAKPHALLKPATPDRSGTSKSNVDEPVPKYARDPVITHERPLSCVNDPFTTSP